MTEQTCFATLRIYSSTKAKMSVLYFFAMFVMFFPKAAGTLVEVV